MSSSSNSASYGKAFNYPRVGFLLSLAAGSLMIIQALYQIFIGSIYYAFVINLGVGITVLFIGILLIIVGIIVYSSAYGMRASPDQHVVAGASVIVFSLIALLFGGGFIVGSILGFVGGLLAIVWRP